MTEKETPLTFNLSDKKEVKDISKKSSKKLLLTVAVFLIVMAIMAFTILFYKVKKENQNPILDYNRSYMQILQTSYINSNYIKAIYECPGNNKYCYFYYDKTINHTSLISSISVDGEIIPITTYQKFNESGTKTVIIKFKGKIKDMTKFFFDCEKLISVDFSNFDSSELTNMNGLFLSCINLKYINWGFNFSTAKVSDMSYLFSNCLSLKWVDLSKFDTSKVKNFNFMFSNCISMTKINVSSFDTSKAVDFSAMFSFCESLTTIDLSNFKTTNVKNMYEMFYSCNDLKNIKFGNFDTSSVTTMQEMFANCGSLETLNLSSFNTSSLESAKKMFENCDNLVSIEQHFTSEKLINTERMFRNCRKLEKIDFSGLDGNDLDNMSEMFANCNSLTSINLSNLVAEKCSDTTKIFYNLPDSGILLYNSLKINRNVLLTLPTGWAKCDVKP